MEKDPTKNDLQSFAISAPLNAQVPTRAAASALRNLAANHNQAQLAIAQAGAKHLDLTLA